jgi:hypothetical protein
MRNRLYGGRLFLGRLFMGRLFGGGRSVELPKWPAQCDVRPLAMQSAVELVGRTVDAASALWGCTLTPLPGVVMTCAVQPAGLTCTVARA